MNTTARAAKKIEDIDGPMYSAPALEKGLDILELLCRSETPLSQKEIASRLDRTVGELYRMLACLVERGYVAIIDEKYIVTMMLFELSHLNPPTHRLLIEAMPTMQKLASDLDQSCHLTVYNQGKQVVISKVDAPSGMGFSVRVGAELDVLVSASGRTLLALQDAETRKLRVEEAIRRRPDQADPQINAILDAISSRGFESIPSVQVRGLYAVAFPILDSEGRAIAALTVPYAERIDQVHRKSIAKIEEILGAAANCLTSRLGGKSPRKPRSKTR
jgi:DNA-binding IclR family transcriptional regulator